MSRRYGSAVAPWWILNQTARRSSYAAAGRRRVTPPVRSAGRPRGYRTRGVGCPRTSGIIAGCRVRYRRKSRATEFRCAVFGARGASRSPGRGVRQRREACWSPSLRSPRRSPIRSRAGHVAVSGDERRDESVGDPSSVTLGRPASLVDEELEQFSGVPVRPRRAPGDLPRACVTAASLTSRRRGR
jgi:hypothetical protein